MKKCLGVISRRFYLLFTLTILFILVINLENAKPYLLGLYKYPQTKYYSNSLWKQKEIIITTWNVSEPSISTYPTIAKEKYNLVLVDDPVKGLDIAGQNRLKAMLSSKSLDSVNLHNPIKIKELNDLIDKVKKNRALEAYFIADEPSANKFNDLAEIVSYLRKRDPSRLAYINLFPTYASEKQLGVSTDQIGKVTNTYPRNLYGIESSNKSVLLYLRYLREFVATVKPGIISYDHYHFFQDRDTPYYFLNLALISQVSKESETPFMNVIQAGRYEKQWRLPTAKEVRFQVYTTLAYGGRGISYFTYWGSEANEGLYRDGKQSPLAKDVAVINAEIQKLSPTLMSLDSQSVYHTKSLPVGAELMQKNSPIKVVSEGEFVVGLFGNKKKTSAFMIVNRNYKNRQNVALTIDITGKRVQELNRTTGKWISISKLSSNRRINLTIEAGDGRFFRVL